ncbi:hypothetical protein KAW38_00715 [Candidatus Micrarchaeota archaeon]|nr:hypothetical protein [Candidatus Micrarchaeota archaeon]
MKKAERLQNTGFTIIKKSKGGLKKLPIVEGPILKSISKPYNRKTVSAVGFNVYSKDKRDGIWTPCLNGHLKGQVLVDLECGKGSSVENIMNLAKENEASVYVGVSIHLNKTFIKYLELPKMDMVLINGDVLSFLSLLPPNSVNYTINGVNSSIFKKEKDIERIAAIVDKTTKNIVFGVTNDVFPMLKEIGWEPLLEGKLLPETVLKKPQKTE